MDTATIIKNARKRAGLTAKQAAERYGCSKQMWSLWETGNKVPNVNTMIRIADALDYRLKIELADTDEVPA